MIKTFRFLVIAAVLVSLSFEPLFAWGKKKASKAENDSESFLPDETEIEDLEDTSDSLRALKVRPWFVYKKTASNIIAGPFDTSEEAIEAWILNPKIKTGKGYFIGRDGVLFTDTPDTYYGRKFRQIEDDLENGITQASKKVSVSVSAAKTEETKPVTPAAAESAKPEIKAPEPEIEPVTEKPVVKITEPEKPVAEPEIPSVSISVIPEFSVPSTETRFSDHDYHRTYLSDYIAKEIFDLPEETVSDIEEDFIDNPNETDSKGMTILMKSVKDGNDWKIRTLIKAGADVNARDKDGWTPLMYAARYQSNLSVLELLLEKKAEVKTTNNYSLSPLIMAACFNDNPDIIRKLLSYYYPSDKEVQKAFVQLISTQQSDTFSLVAKVKLFLDFGLPVNSYYEGKTPLMYACKYCSSTKVIKLLLDKNAAITVRSTEGKTAFDYAQSNKLLTRDEIYWSLNKR